MTKLQRILLAFDFKGTTKPAVERAAYLCQKLGCEIIPVHAVEHIPYHHGLNYWHAIHDVIKPRMMEICDTLSEKGLQVKAPIIKEGRPYDVILSCSEEFNVDIIIIGAGKPSFADSILGTTTVKIIRNARPLVCVVPLDEKKSIINRILCAVDLSLASNEVLMTAINLSRILGAKLTVLHVVPKTKKYPGLGKCDLQVVDLDIPSDGNIEASTVAKDLNKNLQNKMRTVFNKYLDNVIPDSVPYKKLLRQGQPDDEIVKAVKKEDSDLLIMGTVNQKGINRILVGNIAEKIMRKIPCSLITVRHSSMASPRTELRSKSNKAVTLNGKADVNSGDLYTIIENHYGKGQDLFAAGDYKNAITELSKCLEKDNYFYAAHELLVRCYESIGETEKAKEHSESAKQKRRYLWNLRYSQGKST